MRIWKSELDMEIQHPDILDDIPVLEDSSLITNQDPVQVMRSVIRPSVFSGDTDSHFLEPDRIEDDPGYNYRASENREDFKVQICLTQLMKILYGLSDSKEVLPKTLDGYSLSTPEEIQTLIQDGEIDPFLQCFVGLPGTIHRIITFQTSDGQKLYLRALYDPQTNLIIFLTEL